MWLMLNDCFLSIVSKDCARDELLVRARRRGDIEKVFRDAKVIHTPAPADYRFRATVKITEIIKMMEGEIRRITYSNFKNSVDDKDLHDAYLQVWTAMMSVQRGGNRFGNLFDTQKPARKRKKKG